MILNFEFFSVRHILNFVSKVQRAQCAQHSPEAKIPCTNILAAKKKQFGLKTSAGGKLSGIISRGGRWTLIQSQVRFPTSLGEREKISTEWKSESVTNKRTNHV